MSKPFPVFHKNRTLPLVLGLHLKKFSHVGCFTESKPGDSIRDQTLSPNVGLVAYITSEGVMFSLTIPKKLQKVPKTLVV